MASIGGLQVIDRRGDLPAHSSLRYDSRSIGSIQDIVIHHSATPDDRSADDIASYHVEHHGWPGIGYHFLVHQDGRIEWCHSLDVESYGATNHNARSIHVCLVGDFTSSPPGRAQLDAASELVANLKAVLGRSVAVVGHRDIADPGDPTACPGDTWPQWKGQVMAGSGAGGGSGGANTKALLIFAVVLAVMLAVTE